MLLANLPSHERKLYQLALALLAASLMLGVLVGGIGAGESPNGRADNWQASELRAGADTLADFNSVTTQPHWFLEGGQSAVAVQASNAGEPESFRLLGVIEKGGQRHALFMPPATEAGRSTLVQLAVGEPLIGDWKIEEIDSAKVKVASSAENEVRELLLYGTPLKAEKEPATTKRKAGSRAERAATTAPGNKVAKPNAAPGSTKEKAAARPRKDSPEAQKARAERAERRAQAKADTGAKKAEKDASPKHKVSK